MELEDLQKQIEGISANIGKLAEGLSTIAPAVQNLQAQVSDIQAERESTKQAIAAQQSQAEREAERKALLEEIKEVVAAASVEAANQAVPEAISKAINPSRQPARRTTSLVQAGGQPDPNTITISAEDHQILMATKRLAKLRQDGVDSVERLQLVEQLRNAGIAIS